MTTTTELQPAYLDVTKLAVASFLARHREPTLTAYTQDLEAFLGWCRPYDLEVLRVTRGELEMYVRYLEGRGYAAATIARRFGTVATFYKYAVIDGVIAANPADAVTRPKVAWEGRKRTVLDPLEFAALLSAARTSGPNDHALVCLLGMLGLRVSEACAADITDGTKPATSCCTCSARVRSRPTSRYRSQSCAPSTKQSPDDRAGRSCEHVPAGGWTAPAPAGHSLESPAPPGSATRSAHTGCAAPSAPPASWPGSPYATCSTPCGTPTAHHAAVRHGQGQPRPPRRPRRRRLPRRHEHRLSSCSRAGGRAHVRNCH